MNEINQIFKKEKKKKGFNCYVKNNVLSELKVNILYKIGLSYCKIQQQTFRLSVQNFKSATTTTTAK